jgi:hypothetical protein
LSPTTWTNGVNYNGSIAVTGGTPSYTVAYNGNYPIGLAAPVVITNPTTHVSTVSLSGTPAVAGTYTFSLTLTDAVGATSTHSYTLTVNGALMLGAPSTTTANYNSPFTATLAITGGTPSFTKTVTGLPAGWTATLSGTTITITGRPTSQTTIGPVSVTVTDATGATANTSFSITVLAAATTTSLTASPTTAWLVGRAVTLTATVASPAGNPTTAGTVSFYDLASGSPVLLTTVNTTGSVATTSLVLSHGAHQIYAVYNGSTNGSYSPSANSNTISKSVVNTTISSVTASNTKPNQNANVVFSVTVTGYGGGTPAGTVTFIDTTTGATLGTVALNAHGVASLTTAFANYGTHTIVAVFNGQAGPPEWDATGDSNPLAITVKQTVGGRLV